MTTTNTSDLDARLAIAVDITKRAGDLGLDYFRRLDTLTIESKGHQDMVSEADREVELFVRRELAAQFPDDGVVGEEHAPTEGKSGFTWVIDPIDGTANFVNAIPAWTVVIACVDARETIVGVIHEPCTGETFAGRRGGGATVNGKPIKATAAKSLSEGSVGTGFSSRREVRKIIPVIDRLFDDGGVFFRNASGALMLAYVASGRLLGYIEEHMNAWDCLAGLLLIEEAGGSIFTPDPKTVLADGTLVLAGGKAIYPKLQAICDEVFNS